MTVLTWDGSGQRVYETGVDHGVLYMPDVAGEYSDGVAWNGLTTVTESPAGAEPTDLYADNIKYVTLRSAETFGATIEAYTYPPEFDKYDGLATPEIGVSVGQQGRPAFGLSYRTLMGNDLQGSDYGYKLHLIYGCTASPSEKAYSTVNDSPDAITFSWEVATTPVSVTGLKPTSIITIDSTKVDATALGQLEDALYGTAGTDPHLPMPDEVVAFFAGTVTAVTATQPTFSSPNITIPTVTGIRYRRADTGVVVTGTVTVPGTTGDKLVITAETLPGYTFAANSDDDWTFTRT